MELGVTGAKSEYERAPPSDESSYGSGIQKGVVSPPFLFLFFAFIAPVSPLLLFNAPAYIRSPFILHIPHILEMIMVQKPVHLLSSPTTYHRRHPSAPPTVLKYSRLVSLAYSLYQSLPRHSLSPTNLITIATLARHITISQSRLALPANRSLRLLRHSLCFLMIRIPS
jgi:hypothetical protein